MRDRLIKLLQDNPYLDVLNEEHWMLAAEHLLDNGVIVPPVKIGDKVWIVGTKCMSGNYDEPCDDPNNTIGCEDCQLDKEYCVFVREFSDRTFLRVVSGNADFIWGETVFATREEAERALAERKKHDYLR